jgi:putative nucleotidyltransferase with HDIG domain
MGISLISQSLARSQTLKCLERLPKLSPLMAQLLARLSRRNCDFQELTEIVGKDPVLSAQVLQLANSAIFGRLRPVSSVGHAVAMVGVGTLRKFALGSSISNLFSRVKPAQTFSLLRFNLHAVATAALLELLAEEVPFEHGEDAFLAGLLHDIGKLLIAVTFPQQYDDLLAIITVNDVPLLEAERSILGIDHAELSSLAVSQWGLSEAVQAAACHHHDCDPPESAAGARPQRVQLSVGVHHADLFVNHLGMAVLPIALVSQKAPTLEIPGVTFAVEKVLSRFEREVKTLADLFH